MVGLRVIGRGRENKVDACEGRTGCFRRVDEEGAACSLFTQSLLRAFRHVLRESRSRLDVLALRTFCAHLTRSFADMGPRRRLRLGLCHFSETQLTPELELEVKSSAYHLVSDGIVANLLLEFC